MFNPADASRNIKDEFVGYVTTSFAIGDPEYNRLFREKLEVDGSISKGPLVDIKDIFRSGHSLSWLCDQGVLSPLFRDLERDKPRDVAHKISLPLERPLYVHQEKAIDVIATKEKNAIVTTGTGSGKTECFLIPIINELLREKERGTLKPGVRAILIYPMNALANDQMKRLRQLLMYYPDITFGVYNGETEYTEEDGRAKYQDLHKNEVCAELRDGPLPNELVSREKMNAQPPHILCTNYAMLEHMMLRPENDTLFADSDFRFVVLDEAHIYTGATGMETALLLRRLKARIHTRSHTQFILTSATLGKQGESEKDILRFAENLCGETFDAESIVYGERETSEEPAVTNKAPVDLFVKLADTDLDENDVRALFEEYDIPYAADHPVEENLYDLCAGNVLYRLIREKTAGPRDLKDYAEYLGITRSQTASFIHVCSAASKGGKALIDARYHYFVRALEGLYTPLVSPKEVFLDRKVSITRDEKDYAVFERCVCTNCGELAIVGKPKTLGKYDVLGLATQYDQEMKYLHIKGLDENDFEEYDDEDNSETMDDEAEEELSNKQKKEKKYVEYYLCPQCGAITEKEDGRPRCDCNVSPLVVAEFQNAEGKCVKCQRGSYRRFYLGSEAATGVLATSLYEELPARTITELTPDGVELEYRGGKQFLCFSDSRSEAAYFASFLDKSYREFLRRRGLVHVLSRLHEDIVEEPMALEDLEDELEKLFIKNESFKDDLTLHPTRKKMKDISSEHAWMAILTEMLYARRRSSLSSLGLLKFEYCGNTPQIVNQMAKRYGLEPAVCKELLDYLAMSIVYYGAIAGDGIGEENMKYVFYTTRQKTVALQKTGSDDRYTMSWKARNREGKANEFYPNSRARLVARVLHTDEVQANEFLGDYFENWLTNHQNKCCMVRGNGAIWYMNPEHFQVRMAGDPKANWYRCKKCGKITVYNIDGICNENNCGGALEKADPAKLQDGNHYLRLYQKDEFQTLLIREHTAQLSRTEGQAYQTDFEKNHIHALSCSTTFEMGVDVGDLETVFLRDVPPSAANYAQRAGRAGRSKNAAAFALTYAKLSSHDFTYFKEPEKIIIGTIKPPAFKINNEKIVLRHIYAVVLSYFFKNNPQFFAKNKAQPFLDDGGYERFVDMVEQYPAELDDILRKSIPDLDQFDWKNRLLGEDGVLSNAVGEYKDTVAELKGIADRLFDEKKGYEAENTLKTLRRFQANKMIDFLVRSNILPKYGFPIDSVELDVNRDSERVRGALNLSRDLKMAISEYAPGEKVIANNKMYTSRYIKKSFFNNRKDFYISHVCLCDNCKTWNHSLIDPKDRDEDPVCVACRQPLPKNRWNKAIEPRAGFIAENRDHPDEVPMTRPDRIYHSQDSYIGNGQSIQEYVLNVNNHYVTMKSSENDEIMVTSNTLFYVCKFCGYTYGIHDPIKDGKKKDVSATSARDKKAHVLQTAARHRNEMGYPCPNNYFYPFVLNHKYKTDVVVLDFVDTYADSPTMLSVIYAILNGMADQMDIDIDDISGCLKAQYSKDSQGLRYTIVLYDTVAGGAGNVRRLLDPATFQRVIEAAYHRMTSCNCDTSCYNCLRSYSNQRYHEILNRNSAALFLRDYLGSASESTPEEVQEKTKKQQTKAPTQAPLKDYVDAARSGSMIFSTWDELTDYFDDDAQPVLAELAAAGIPLSDYFGIKLKKMKVSTQPVFAWVEKDTLMFAGIVKEEDRALCEGKGWKVFGLQDIDIAALKEALN